MSLIDGFMPAYTLRQLDRVAVAASAARAYEVVRRVDLQRLALSRLLFGLRTLPDRVGAALRQRPARPSAFGCIEDITRPGSGFILLGEAPGHEVVVGSVGKFWQPSIEFATVTPASFRTFAQAGFGRLAWCLRVDERTGGGAWVTVELRVGATDAASLARFRPYWWLIGRFSHAIRRVLLRAFVREFGPAPDDATRPLPGDELLPSGRTGRTDAVTVEAPPERVWPWLVQMGCRRAGWYSFDWLDNGGVPSAQRILPGLQNIQVGDLLPATPTDTAGFAVLRSEPPRVLVLGSPSLLPDSFAAARQGRFGMFGANYLATWAFVLEPIGPTATRLVVRVRAEIGAGAAAGMTRAMVLPIHAIMEHQQLRNLKRRAELRTP